MVTRACDEPASVARKATEDTDSFCANPNPHNPMNRAEISAHVAVYPRTTDAKDLESPVLNPFAPIHGP